MKLIKRLFLYSLVLGIFPFLVTGCLTYSAQNNFRKISSGTSYDAIIVPGVPLENGKWSDVMKARVYWGCFLYQKGIAKNIIFSGSAVYTPYIEAQVMALYAEQLGIPTEHIYTEKQAEHSTENLYYSYKLSKKLGFKTIALASDPFQSKMLEKFSHKLKLPIDFVPIAFSILDSIPKIDPKIDESKAFAENFISIEEREGFWKRFAGTRGKNIRYDIYDDNTTSTKP